ncbi:MAG: pyridoxal-phosphate dependent enzyme [Candidatus Latescibacteria bacterium]|jgi:L-serine/L-threonine ammonia-lyase|nr:pyridoxal-phosphate dependent enzyme [Candidatus Latescibacterota bacterium]
MNTSLHVESPLWDSVPMSDALGSEVLMKMDALQPVGSFKIRGIGNLCRIRCEDGATGLVSSSGGNAGYAAAYAGRKLGVPVTVVVPETTSEWMRDLLRKEDALVVEHGTSWFYAHEFAVGLAKDQGAGYIHPFDDPHIWHGHATMVDEMARQGPKPGTIVVAVGGGGLLCGIIEGMHRVGWQDVPLLAVETEGAASFASAVAAGKIVTLDRIDTIAVTLGSLSVTQQALDWTKKHTVIPWLVSDRQAVTACRRFLDDHRILVEPACGAALAAVYDRAVPIANKSPVMAVVCGGAGVNISLLDQWHKNL